MAYTMEAKNALASGKAECYITIEGKRYNFMQAVDLEAKFERNKQEVPILGRTGVGNKTTGWKGTGKATFYYNQSIFREIMLNYKNGGADIYFDMQVTNEDSTSDVGRQTVTLIGCNIDDGILTKFAVGDEVLEEDMNFTFEDFEMPEKFTDMYGFS